MPVGAAGGVEGPGALGAGGAHNRPNPPRGPLIVHISAATTLMWPDTGEPGGFVPFCVSGQLGPAF